MIKNDEECPGCGELSLIAISNKILINFKGYKFKPTSACKNQRSFR